MTTISLNPIYVNICVVIPGLTFPIVATKRGGDDSPKHKRVRNRGKNENPGWNRKRARAEKLRETQLLYELHKKYRTMRDLPLGEFADIVEKVAPRLVQAEKFGFETREPTELELLSEMTRGRRAELERVYIQYQAEIERYNEQAIQYLLSQVL